MAKPQTEEGFTRIANELLDAIARVRIPGEVRQVLDVIFRMTYGWHRKEAVISLTHFANATGLKKPNVIRCLRVLISMNLIIRTDNTPASKYKVNKDFDTWCPLSKLIPGIRTDNRGGIRTDNKAVSELITPMPSDASTGKGQREPKDIKERLKDNNLSLTLSYSPSLRERLFKKIKKHFPNISSIPEEIHTETVDYLVYKIEKGDIRPDVIKHPIAYLKALVIGEAFPSFLEREAKDKQREEKAKAGREREKEEERTVLESRIYHRQKAREVIKSIEAKNLKK